MDTFLEKLFENQEAEGVIMSVHKDVKRGTWFAKIKYTDWAGERRETTKRGFAKKKDALLFEQEFLRQKAGSPSMKFKDLYALYMEDLKPRIRATSYQCKEYLFTSKLLPFFGHMACDEITPAQIRKWQNELVNQNYRPTYLRIINNQLTAIFNFAVKYYGLPSNPVKRAGSMGKCHADAMQFWTVEEFQKFIASVKNPAYKTIFSLLFWTGMRIGEALALNYNDFDFHKQLVHVTKSYAKVNGHDLIGPPKTPKSVRDITLPSFLSAELQLFIRSLGTINPTARLFETSKNTLGNELKRSAASAGVKKIRLHDLRHSHASYLIHRGVPILAVSKRLGHETIETTLRTYAHLYPQERDIVLDAIENDPLTNKGSFGGHTQLDKP